MSENKTDFLNEMPEYQENYDMQYEFLYTLSEEFERDSRRYNRAFTTQEVSTK